MQSECISTSKFGKTLLSQKNRIKIPAAAVYILTARNSSQLWKVRLAQHRWGAEWGGGERTDFLLFRCIHSWWQDLDFTLEPAFQRDSRSSLELEQHASDYNFTAFFMPETIYLNSKSWLPALWGKIKTIGWERILNPVKIEMCAHKIKKYMFYSSSTMIYTYNHIRVNNMNSLFLWVVICIIYFKKG